MTTTAAKRSQHLSDIAWFDTHASEISPAYPVLFAAAFCDAIDAVTLRVRPQASRADVLAALASGTATLAALPVSVATGAIARGLDARIVCAAVAPTDFASIEQEPLVPWDRVASGVRHLAPRAVLVASRQMLEAQPARVGSAISAYWRGAEQAADAPALLGVLLATEFGINLDEADRVARRAVASWRLDPAVRLGGLRRVIDAQHSRGDLPAGFTGEDALDERFVRAESNEPRNAMRTARAFR